MKALIIDSNERGPLPEAVLRRAMKKKPPVPIKREALVIGDYLCGQWHLEAKSVSDFLESLRSGHLMRQLDNLDANAATFGIIVWVESQQILVA
jgi:ERCC4-type nuclease